VRDGSIASQKYNPKGRIRRADAKEGHQEGKGELSRPPRKMRRRSEAGAKRERRRNEGEKNQSAARP